MVSAIKNHCVAKYILGVTIMNFVNEKEIPATYKNKYYELLGNIKLKGKNSFYINQKKFKDNCNHWTVDYENDCFLGAFPHGERGLAMTLKTFIFYWNKQFFYVAACRELVENNGVNFLNYYYTAYKLCELLGEDKYLPDFPMLKDREKRIEQDEIWKKICEELNYTIIPSL